MPRNSPTLEVTEAKRARARRVAAAEDWTYDRPRADHTDDALVLAYIRAIRALDPAATMSNERQVFRHLFGGGCSSERWKRLWTSAM